MQCYRVQDTANYNDGCKIYMKIGRSDKTFFLELSCANCWQQWDVANKCDTHSANFDEKVHKPQSKSYGRIGANMQLIFTHILWIWILLSVHHNFLGSEGLQGTHIDALNPFSSKLMTLTLRGGLWTFLANSALCGAPCLLWMTT